MFRKMEDDLENTETTADEDPKPKKRKKLIIPWKSLALYILPALIVFIIFILMHNTLVQPPLSREEIMALINDKNEEEFIISSSSKGVTIADLNDQYYWKDKFFFGTRIFN